MKKEEIETIINYALDKGIEYAELFFENKNSFGMVLSKNKVDNCNSNRLNGVGIRLFKDNLITYSSTSVLTEENLKKIIDQISSVYKKEKGNKKVKLKNLKIAPKKKDIIYLENHSKNQIKNLLIEINCKAKKLDPRIKNIEVYFGYTIRHITIANSDGNYVNEERIRSSIYVNLVMEEKDNKTYGDEFKYLLGGLEILKNFNIDQFLNSALKKGQKKLKAVNIPGGKMPVILANGTGATLFHEAVGHSLEAYAVARGISTFDGLLNKKIASDVVTLIDDGSKKGLSGTTYFDDEGNKTKKNILIENGILKSYLVDIIDGGKINQLSTGSARRESYTWAPNARMNNTYLAKGNSKIKDMIKSIDYGMYVYELNGGQVKIDLGEFTFGVSLARLIENGKLTKYVKDITLIGKCNEILHKVEMVSNDLKFVGTGLCGSASGNIPVSEGQPTIKITEILVGGKED